MVIDDNCSSLKNAYSQYLFMCHCEGDIWNEDNVPYTMDEWVLHGMPPCGGNPRKL